MIKKEEVTKFLSMFLMNVTAFFLTFEFYEWAKSTIKFPGMIVVGIVLLIITLALFDYNR